jgi:DNA polymerase-3 subunit epsilon
MLNFTAIDFETANSNRASVCAVGLAKVRDGQLVATRGGLIRPALEFDDFNYFNICVHGIEFEDVRDAPEWYEVYPELREFIDDDTLVAHNAVFDRGCLEAVNRCYGFGERYDFACTCLTARRLLPQLPNHKLPTVAAYLGVSEAHHHDAADDAIVCANIAIELDKRGELTLLNNH